MRLNSLVPAEGSRPVKKRVGRGIGCGSGKTCGRGHKGQKARSGGGAKFGFEGGQMPIQRRLPKSGFNSKLARRTSELRLDKLAKVEADVIDMLELVKSGLVKASKIDRVKIIASGKLEKAVHVRGIKVTAGARAAIEAAGGKVED